MYLSKLCFIIARNYFLVNRLQETRLYKSAAICENAVKSYPKVLVLSNAAPLRIGQSRKIHHLIGAENLAERNAVQATQSREEDVKKKKNGRWEARYIHHYEDGKTTYHSDCQKTFKTPL